MNLELIKEVKQELEQMEARLEHFKGDKTPFKATLSRFKRLLEAYRSKCIDELILNADNAILQTSVMNETIGLNLKSEALRKKEAFIDEYGSGLSEENMYKIANDISKALA